MNISDIYSAKGNKFSLTSNDSIASFQRGGLLKIETTQSNSRYLVSQYGEGITNDEYVLCSCTANTSAYLMELFELEQQDIVRCMFVVEGISEQKLEVQAYTFNTVTEYKTPIVIAISDKLNEATTPEKLAGEFVWKQLGMPALFCLNYKSQKKQKSKIRFIGGKRLLIAQNTALGITADSINYAKDRYDIPVDVFVAPEVRFVRASEQQRADPDLADALDTISNPATYFARWEAYEKLSKKLLEQESEEFGEIPYSSYSFKTDERGIAFEFSIEEEIDEIYIGCELGASEVETVTPDDRKKPSRRQFSVGVLRKTDSGKVTTYLASVDNLNTLPEKGVLCLFTAGDQYIMSRRLAARKRMLNHKSPIKSIVALIETGTSKNELLNPWGEDKAITVELKRNFPKAADLNQEQEDALKIAINTPDIALIQGPPGTGKTTVIKAIVERFREIFENDEKKHKIENEEHVLRSPKILISSFQNEAVDNAISAPLPGDIPAFRKTAKRANNRSSELYQKALDTWYTSLTQNINGLIADDAASTYSAEKHSLDDEYLSYKNSGESIECAAALIKRYLGYVDIPYPHNLRVQAEDLLRKIASSDDEDEDDPIIKKLESQRLDRESFEDDGSRNARKLRAFLSVNHDIEVGKDDIELISRIGDEEFTDDEFAAYVACIIKLKKRFCTGHVSIDPRDKQAVNELILALADFFSRHYIDTLSSMESKKSLVLCEFLRRLSQDYESIAQKYSMTTAATCQTCLDLREDTEKIYDLVIIDEAARANPLDLFIPMSMGKKIILVGDHKQLPHMLEPDVLKLLTNDPEFKDIPEIEKSLFERLFGMFSGGERPKAVALTHQYRMHPDICQFVSDAFYDGMLKTADGITTEDRSSPNEINGGNALTFVDIPLSKGAETRGPSKSRPIEVDAICQDVRHILNVIPETNIGIISFYSAQVALLQNRLSGYLNDDEMSHVEIGTVDAFQGREFEYVMLSCVRSNRPKAEGERPQVGFLEKANRLCVAFSRAKRQLIVYGDANTLMQIPCINKLYDLCKNSKGGGYYREY